MRPWLVWTIGIALIAAAWAVVQVTPEDAAAEAPFAVRAAVGEEATGRALSVTVTDVRLGDRAVAGGWRAEGTWVVVDLRAQALREEQGSLLGHAALVIDGTTYRASERPASMFRSPLAVGIPREGSIAFELPADLADRSGTLQLALDAETRLDSLIEVPLDLGALDPQDEVDLLTDGWALG